MDVSGNRAGSAVTATVIRQFTPSRIERELLAQAFELVCGQRHKVEATACEEPNAARTRRVGKGTQAIETHIARRRVA